MFNDDAGFELVNLQAQRDLNSLVKNDERRHVNRDRTTTIDNDETITVHGKRTEVVDKDEHITIHQNRTEVVDLDETITIHQNRQERVDENETLDIGGNRTETVHKSEQVTIKGNRDKTVKGNDTLNVDKNRKENVHKSRSLNVDKNNTELVKMAKSVTVGLAYVTQVGTIMNTAVGIMQTEQVGRIKKSFVGKSYSITAGDEFKITVGKSSLVMNADGSIIITGSTIVTQAEKENKVIGKDVLINPPGASAGSIPDDYDYEEGSTIPGTNTYVGEPDQGGGGIDADLTKPIYSERALSDATKPVYSDKKTTPNNKGKPKTVSSGGTNGETAEEYRKRVGGAFSKASEIIASTGDFIEEAAPVNPTKGAKWVSGAAKVVGNKMKDGIQASDKGILEATGEVISDTFDDATKKARELANWWNKDLNPNYPKRDDDD